MTHRRTLLAALPALLLCLPAWAQAQNTSASPAAAPALKISGSVSIPLELSLADLKSMPRKKLTVVNPHDKKTEVYEGVPLLDLLHKAGVPEGEHIRGAAMATYLLAAASDGYRVVFSLAELDPAFLDSDVLIADTLDGAPLGPNQGPLKLVVPHDKRPARWLRMLQSLTVVALAK
ncbi:MAG TPA: molybdopterin-dependent oxidoreductase [Candidatus Acidoferrales bacterium]|nr:molybdopterin-dependent oxidoreductase [Candidatus Acidoferrales bacterium]